MALYAFAVGINQYITFLKYISDFPAAAAAKSLQFVSDPVRPHRRQPTRLPRPRDSPGKNTGVGCHCLLRVTSQYTLFSAGKIFFRSIQMTSLKKSLKETYQLFRNALASTSKGLGDGYQFPSGLPTLTSLTFCQMDKGLELTPSRSLEEDSRTLGWQTNRLKKKTSVENLRKKDSWIIRKRPEARGWGHRSPPTR